MNILAYVHLRNIVRSTGAGRVARELMEHVAGRDGVNMHILADRADHAAIAGEMNVRWASFPYHLFSTDTSRQQRNWMMYQRPTAEHFWPEAQIVHCAGESYVPTDGSRLVVTVHDAAYFDHGAHPLNLSTLKQQVKWRVLYRTLLRKVDAFHTVSHFSAERLAAAFPSIRSRLRVVYNGVSSLFFEPRDSAVEQLLLDKGLKNRRYVLLPGGLHYRKNADMVLKAWPILQQRFPDVALVVAGHNHAAYLPLAAELGKSVILTGFIEDKTLRALYHGAEVVWFPSRYEGFGLPVLEAMACGAAVVASNTTSIPEISGDAALLVSPNSLDENVEAVDAVIQDGQLRATLQKRGKKRALPFTWDASSVQMREIYSSLL
jgi:glycosyltransferase involved in cell wall biosynthesis